MADTVSAGSADEYPENSIQRAQDFKWHQRYPPPKPPKRKKDEIFVVEHYKEVDKKAKQVSVDSVGSVQDLVKRLTVGMMNDLDKVRAIFTWLGGQNVLKMDLKNVRIENTVKGYLKIVKDDRSTYTEIMAIMCREAGVPCLILSGPARGALYDVGDMKDLRSSWNAVYVADSWRLIHPQWAFCKIVGHENSNWFRLESNQKRDYQEINSKVGTEEQVVDEFFFLTDPEMFIHFCCPDDPKWQLLKIRITRERFFTLPYVHPRLFKTGITFKRSQTCFQNSTNGETRVFVTAQNDPKVKLTYDFYIKMDEKVDRSLFQGQESLIIKSNAQEDGTISFFVRCITSGEYRLRLYIEVKEIPYWICDFKIHCEDSKYTCHALPYISEIGWGPGPLTKQFGLSHFSHPEGVIVAHQVKLVEVAFKMGRTLSYQIQLKHHRLPDNELLHACKLTTRFDQVSISVNLPEDGLYVLKIGTKRDSDRDGEFKNVLNYVIDSDPMQNVYRGRDNPAQRIARHNMKEAMRSGNKTVLAIAIERFRKTDAEDKNDLTQAMETLDVLETKEDLKFAMMKNRYDKLGDAINRAQNSPRSEKFASMVQTALEQRNKLQYQAPTEKTQVKVTKRTIADLKSYKTPPLLVYDVVRAAYLILGENELRLDSWVNVRSLLHKTGRDALDYRLQQDPGFNPVDKDMLDIEAKARDILNKYEVNSVGKLSPAGEAVYLQTLALMEKREQERNNAGGEPETGPDDISAGDSTGPEDTPANLAE